MHTWTHPRRYHACRSARGRVELRKKQTGGHEDEVRSRGSQCEDCEYTPLTLDLVLSSPPQHRKSSQNTFVLEAHAVNGNIRLAIPRTFCGPIVVSHQQGFVGVSDSISRHLTTFGEADNTRRCFLGDFRQYSTAPEASKEGWSGDELILSVRYGNVKIQYDDDAAGSIVKTRPNTILNRFFGF